MGNKAAHHRPPVRHQEKAEEEGKAKEEERYTFKSIKDRFETVEEVQEALRKAGLESSNLIIGIDYTISNTSAGKSTFHGLSLHALDPSRNLLNPYQQVIQVLGETLSAFDDDGQIPVYGFGDKVTKDQTVFPFFKGALDVLSAVVFGQLEDLILCTIPRVDRPCNGLEEVLSRYEQITPQIQLGGPTSFAPLIREAIKIVRENDMAYHILIIIADGQVTPDSEYCQAERETKQAIVEASNYPLSIILVGVGDGPWDTAEEFDDGLPTRRFDNFQFVNFEREFSYGGAEFGPAYFALAALQEIPEQYHAIRKLRLM